MIGYFDCFSGAAGDMILSAMLSAGLPEAHLRSQLEKLNVTGYELEINHIKKQGFAAVKVDVHINDKPAHRHLHHITRIIDDSSLADSIKTRSKQIFTRLAEAEAKVHGTTIEKVHFHEVGAIDAIVDVVGACIGVEALGLTRIVCSPIPTGSGTVKCDHGLMPVPAPATAELLRGIPIAECAEQGELLTPTGAAILGTLAESFGPLPPMKIDRIGYGAGTRDGKTRPNILRLIIGTPTTPTPLQEDEVVVLETNIDDATGQQIGRAVDALFAAGALDVFTLPIQMKKNRPGILLSVIAEPATADACEAAMFAHTPTFGVRRQTWSRRKLDRRIDQVTTPFGEIRVKLGLRGAVVCIIAPENDDCAAAAEKHGASLHDVAYAAESAWRAANQT